MSRGIAGCSEERRRTMTIKTPETNPAIPQGTRRTHDMHTVAPSCRLTFRPPPPPPASRKQSIRAACQPPAWAVSAKAQLKART